MHCTLFIFSRMFSSELDPKITAQTSQTTVSRYGNVKEAKVLQNPDGSPRGKAFVTFESTQIAKELVQKTMTVNGAEVTVQPVGSVSRMPNVGII